MLKYEYLLKAVGYNHDRIPEQEEPLQIEHRVIRDIESGEEKSEDIIIPVKPKTTIKKCNPWYILNSVVFALISWKVFYTIYVAISRKDTDYGGLVSFPVLVISQYCIGIRYFNKEYFHNKMKIKKMRVKYNIYLIISSIVGFLLTIVSVVLFWYNFDIYGYTDLCINQTDTMKGGITVLLFFDLFFSHQIIAINFSSFVGNLIYLKYAVITMTNDITTGMQRSTSIAEKIDKIAGSYKKTKGQFSKNVSETDPMFESLNILTLIHLGFLANMITNDQVYVIQIVYAVVYVGIYAVFLYIIHTVNKSAGDIDDIINGDMFLTNFSSESNIPLLTPEENDTMEELLKKLFYNSSTGTLRVIEVNQKNGWKILRDEVKEDWAKYKILGFIEVDGANIIGAIISVLTTLFFGVNLAELFIL